VHCSRKEFLDTFDRGGSGGENTKASLDSACRTTPKMNMKTNVSGYPLVADIRRFLSLVHET
jgi:hypothetical protein